ncbi:MAG: hypothetical protein E4H15_02625 [Syntrophobacterales bacterium]|nr:MAG: hypothetical protein E4H15_02625 [Syntrophobacterales bacterium]
MTTQLHEPDNLVKFLDGSVANYPDRPLFGTKNAQGVYEWISYAQVGRRVNNLRAGLAGLGVGRDDAVGIIANNRLEWAVGAFASFGLGDRGRLDKDGFLHITGRINEQFKLENGKFVFPASLEEDICLVPFVENAMIFGEGKEYTVCLVVPDPLALEKYAAENNLPADTEELIQTQEIRDRISRAITESLRGKYGSYEIPKKFIYITENFSLENGTLTQTMKVKRRIVLERYRKEIEALYTR